nr:MAG TPA: hypothetical protein [Caudoviricetes sp.]
MPAAACAAQLLPDRGGGRHDRDAAVRHHLRRCPGGLQDPK